jgi:hypothetical protein
LRDLATRVGRKSRARLNAKPTSVPRATNALSIFGSSPYSSQAKGTPIFA